MRQAEDGPRPGAGDLELVVPGVDADGRTSSPIRITYVDSKPEAAGSAPTVVLVHGSPGGKRDFRRLAAALPDRFRVVALDLPGFGASSLDLPDCSFRAHARYVLELMDRLGVERFHVVGFSMGGGVALNLSDIAPRRVASVTMLSAIGVQEMELFGDYALNHTIHGAQVGLLWAMFNLVPHMGALGDGRPAMSYARNFFESDQRPLRRMLMNARAPMLILHGRKDPLVPVEAAIEHHRLVPQSELTLFDEDHFMTFQRGRDMGAAIGAFLLKVESGERPTRDQAAADRVRAAAVPFDFATLPSLVGVPALLVIVMLAVGGLAAPRVAAIGAGLAAGLGRIGVLVPSACLLLVSLLPSLALRSAGPAATWRGRGLCAMRAVAGMAASWSIAFAAGWSSRRLGASRPLWISDAWMLLVMTAWAMTRGAIGVVSDGRRLLSVEGRRPPAA